MSRVPGLAKPRAVKLPPVSDVVLDNGLRVLAVRRPGVPLMEVRLRIPLQEGTSRTGAREAR